MNSSVNEGIHPLGDNATFPLALERFLGGADQLGHFSFQNLIDGGLNDDRSFDGECFHGASLFSPAIARGY